jgi:hypothetical protein
LADDSVRTVRRDYLNFLVFADLGSYVYSEWVAADANVLFLNRAEWAAATDNELFKKGAEVGDGRGIARGDIGPGFEIPSVLRLAKAFFDWATS